MMAYFVYVIKSEKTGKSYIGHSKELKNRVTEHNAGKSKSTRGKGPWKLIHFEEFDSRSEAMKREYYYKSQTGRLVLKEKGIL